MLFVDGRLDRILENAAEPCAGAVYAPFTELEKNGRAKTRASAPRGGKPGLAGLRYPLGEGREGTVNEIRITFRGGLNLALVIPDTN